jgi:hypothetical protein
MIENKKQTALIVAGFINFAFLIAAFLVVGQLASVDYDLKKQNAELERRVFELEKNTLDLNEQNLKFFLMEKVQDEHLLQLQERSSFQQEALANIYKKLNKK